MPARRLYAMTAHETADLLRRREVSSEELTRAVFDRIRAVEGKIQAFVSLTEEGALEQARMADRRRAAGEEGPL
ncbi:MAG: Asp-tRNA(Asn)/Glu-tRNA(Gln) amidotransferase subunit GatA, partial [Chloroflexi bacterium]|nr:Asp-tRNA(Asn)/Glu-tRNA(Gln) amidotransferase subunit GatA [Chloroflexota bacterium]